MSNLFQNISARMDAVRNVTVSRPKVYDNIDGTGEMFFGLMILGFTLLGWLQTFLPKGSLWMTNFFARMLFMSLVLGPMLGLGFWGRTLIKRHLTWPRTGYLALGLPGTGGNARRSAGPAVKAKMLQGFWLLIGIAVPAAVLGLGVAAVVVFEMRHPDMPGLVLAGYVFYLGFFPVIYAFWIWAMGRGHAWKWWLWLFLALGLLVIGLTGPGNFIEVAQPVIGFAGLVWFASGAGTLLLYLRHHPRPLPEAE